MPLFLSDAHSGIRSELIHRMNYHLFCDENAKMKDLEKVFLTMSMMNSLKISFVNDILLTYNDSTGFEYKYEKLTKNIPPFMYDDDYSKIILENPPPPPPSFSLESKKEKINYIFLINNKIFYNKKEVRISEIITILKEAIINKQVILSLYDLDSNYKKFLEITSQITYIYEDIRNENSKNIFNQELGELNREEFDSIRKLTPMKYFWSYSIPHYRNVYESNPRFFGMKSKSIDSLLPN